MRKKLWTCLALMLVIPGLLFMTSCAKQAATGPDDTIKNDGDPPPPPPPIKDDTTPPPPPKGGDQGDTGAANARHRFLNEDVYFELDRATLTAASQNLLERKANYLRNNPSAVKIEGHCDERGTTEYNMVLGAERAESVKNFLVNLGIPADSMTTISFGEEKPVDGGSDEEAWAKNRRAHFSL